MAKKYHIIKATTKDMTPTLDGELFPLAPNGSAVVNDSGIAAEIDQVYGNKGTGEVVVAEQKDTAGEPDHTYFFGGKNSKEWDDFWKRYEKKKRCLMRLAS